MVPKVTTPLTKLIRTLEGILIIAANAVLVIVPLAGSLPWGTSVKYLTILNSVAFVSRQVLKGVASFSPLVGAPTFPPGLPPALENEDTATQVAADLNYEVGPPEVQDPSGLLEEDGAAASSLAHAGAPDEAVQPGGNTAGYVGAGEEYPPIAPTGEVV